MTKNNKKQNGNLSPALVTGVLKTSGKPYSIHILDESWIEEVYSLHAKVVDTLSPDETTFLVHRKKEFFEEHMKNGGTVLGIISEDTLIAKSVIYEPGTGDAGKATKIQANTVDPAYQNNGLTQHLIKTWVTLALLRGHDYLEAEVDVRNTASLKTLINNGLTIIETRVDPDDGGLNYTLKALTKTAALTIAFNKVAANDNAHAIDLTDVEQIDKKLTEGYHGVAVDGKNKKLILAPKKKAAP